MSRIAYVNGRYVNHAEAMVHVEDRGYQFADGVYEVCEVARGYIMDMRRHLDRLDRSLRELRIAWPMKRAALEHVMREVVRRNGVKNGLVYLQVTRGVARRDHFFPTRPVAPALVVTAKKTDPAAAARRAEAGIGVITVPENRWERVDIKTVGLLPNVLARQQAREAGAQEAWFVDADGTVKEGAATNAWIVSADGNAGDAAGRLRHPAGHHPRDGDGRGGQARPEGRGEGLHRRGGQAGARGLHYRGEHGGHAGRCDRRRTSRERPSGLRRAFPAPCLF